MPPTGDSVAYVGGAKGLDIPRADGHVYRQAHATKKKATGLDWDALTPTCKGCGEKSGQLDAASHCPTCRGEAPKPLPIAARGRNQTYAEAHPDDLAQRFNAPTDPPPSDDTPLGRDLADLEATDPKVAASAARLQDTINRITRPDDHVRPENLDADQPASVYTEQANLQAQLDHATRVLRDTATSAHPAVKVLRANAIGALEALHLIHHLHQTPAAASSTGVNAAAGHTSAAGTGKGKPTRRPANRQHNGPVRLQLPADTVDRYRAGATTTQLANELGVSIPTVRRWLLDHGVQLRAARVDYTPELIDQVRRLYTAEEKTQAEIATILGVSTKVVQTAMDLAGVDRREAKARVGRDTARGLKDRITALGVPTRDIKAWAVEQGLLERITVGLPSRAVVDAYAATHPREAAS
ncbi:hypothetical protein [Nocardioides sp. SYSU DS0663]|uniref:hypothetical protein n=1 Tax=Nocardioides sp. SYSU DS0663 TaxID=3416445 RepID=UPI003F4C26D2